jgi:hypothetical protein
MTTLSFTGCRAFGHASSVEGFEFYPADFADSHAKIFNTRLTQ